MTDLFTISLVLPLSELSYDWNHVLQSLFRLAASSYVCLRAQSCPTLCDPMDYSPPGPSVHGILWQEYWSGLQFFPLGDLVICI